MSVVSLLPTVNATLNGICAILLVAGFLCIRAKHTAAHTRFMLGACGVSVLFLASYLTYHFLVGSIGFPGTGWVRVLYLTILISHVVLAIVILPLVLRTVYLAGRGRFVQHVGIARVTLPLWLYVSVTGVVVYMMLYGLRGSA